MRIHSTSLLAVCFLASIQAGAQNDTALVTDIVATPNYFLVVLFGVMLAVGFQFLLTSLSVAIGVSAVPNLKKSYVEARYGNTSDDENDDDWNETNSGGNTGVVVTSALGIWNVLTAALSLFGATALALTLTPVVTTTIAITLGLTIWAVFYLLMFYLEGRMVGTMIGSLINTAVAGLRAGGEAVKSLFGPSPTSQVQSVADNTIEKLRQEMSATFDTDGITQAIENFTNTVGKKVDKVGNNLAEVPTYDQLKADLKEVVKAGGNQSNPAKWTAIQSAVQSAIDGGDDDDSESGKNKTEQLRELLAEAKKAAGSNGSGNAGKSNKNGGDTTYVDQVTNYLQSATPESFDVDQLKKQLLSFADDPKGAYQELSSQIASMDKDAIVAAITQNTSLEKKQVNEYADRVTKVLTSVRGTVDSKTSAAGDKANDLLSKLESGIAGFVDSTDDDRLDYSSLKNDFVRAMNNPNDSLDIVSRRLDTYDRDTLVSLLTNNSKINRSDINNIVGQVEEAKATVTDQIQAVRDKANSAKNQTMRRAAIQAEHARATAVSAAWWLFAAIVISGGAAILGSVTGI